MKAFLAATAALALAVQDDDEAMRQALAQHAVTVTPEPAAIRARREPLSSFGFARSCGVIDRMSSSGQSLRAARRSCAAACVSGGRRTRASRASSTRASRSRRPSIAR